MQLHLNLLILTASVIVEIWGNSCVSSQSPLTQALDLIGGPESGFWFRLVDLLTITEAISLLLSFEGGVCQTF